MKRTLSLSIAALAAALLVPGTAAAAPLVPVVAGEFDLGETPGRVTADAEGNAWVILTSGGREIAKVTPGGVVTTYDSPAFRSPLDITVGPDGNLWVSQSASVARFTTADPAAAIAYPVPGLDNAQGITTGPDQNIWTAGGDDAVQINPANGRVIRSFTVAGMSSRGITTSGGNLWIADTGEDRVVELTTAGATTFYSTGTDSDPQEVAAGLAGQVGYTAAGLNPDEIGLITPPGPAVGTPTPRTDAFGIAFGRDHAYWVANFISHDLTRLTSTGQVSTLPLSDRSGPRHIAASLVGTLWVGLESSGRIALISGLEVPQPPPGPPPPVGDRGPPTTTTPPVVPPSLVPRPTFTNVSLTRSTTFGRSATLRLAVDEADLVTIRLERKSYGRLARGRCVLRVTRANRRGRRCSRYVQRAATPAPVRNGTVSATFNRSLAIGSYRVTLSATNGAGTTTAARYLTVKPKPRARARPRGRARR